ncbi:protoporphyrinogen oxidase [Rhodobacteraceae bacterium THAF1]|uniref:NAD(P)/FAD-dependent oxidoreductase n=1 Tax=Palleronia sp. THAF1 TaxID=2587842 RepID=UPI000F403983|nr:FAD-dependent oxidoreductase [Palleronia sp. THAF1]QFU09867.1 protoporphyrinogen oxidase [Palleronia sp. THAF1]VDC17230.1 protoporphyrinogen oxidase [Rhodobacteraceae bacterium THAF1]
MPFDTSTKPRIAIIGGGISGMAAAWRLKDAARVTLFEAAPRLGGHARTVVAGKRGDQPVDTGFIVFNRVNYPHLVQMFEDLNVPITDSDMSFGASFGGGRFEYGLRSLGALFAQKRNAADPRFLRMIRDILRFNARALETAQPGMSLSDLLDRLGTGDWFRDRYLLPLSGAIWSTPSQGILDFPADALIRFFKNHALLHHTGQHQWLTVKGGSVEYVWRLEAALRHAGVTIRTGAAVQSVSRAGGAQVRIAGAEVQSFDQVIFATHSDDALALLADPSPEERAALGAVRYQFNSMVLHADARQMPKRRAVWSAWNYCAPDGPRPERIDLTYWMNTLQPIPKDDPLFVTLNATTPIDEALIYDQCEFRHPVYDAAAEQGRRAIRAMNGTRATWFCGAWMRDGFHEDGFASAVDVTDALLAQSARLAAE